MTNDQALMTNEKANGNAQSPSREVLLLFAFCRLISHCLLPFAV
jgi:hypothetical protein